MPDRAISMTPPMDEANLALYVEGTGGALGELALRCLLGNETPSDAVPVARAVGRAWAWIGLARGLHRLRRYGSDPFRPEVRSLSPARRA